jgi:hypothetical protein
MRGRTTEFKMLISMKISQLFALMSSWFGIQNKKCH